MNKTIVLVACASTKLETQAKAKDLYTSELFKKSREYAERIGDIWLILSAKHHLLDPETLTTPYDRTLNMMNTSARSFWALTVANKLTPKINPGDRVIFLAGVKYRESLIYPCTQAGASVECPLAGLGIGQQLQFLTKQNNQLDEVKL